MPHKLARGVIPVGHCICTTAAIVRVEGPGATAETQFLKGDRFDGFQNKPPESPCNRRRIISLGVAIDLRASPQNLPSALHLDRKIHH